MEASPLHATAVSPRQKAVCIIMGCHLISSGRGQGDGGVGPRRGGQGRRVIGVQSLAQIVFYRLSHLALGVPTAAATRERVIESARSVPTADPFGPGATFSEYVRFQRTRRWTSLIRVPIYGGTSPVRPLVRSRATRGRRMRLPLGARRVDKPDARDQDDDDDDDEVPLRVQSTEARGTSRTKKRRHTSKTSKRLHRSWDSGNCVHCGR